MTLADLEQFLRPLIAAMAGGFFALSAAEQTKRLAERRLENWTRRNRCTSITVAP